VNRISDASSLTTSYIRLRWWNLEYVLGIAKPHTRWYVGQQRRVLHWPSGLFSGLGEIGVQRETNR
jgi:hypothetical protein